MGTHPSRCEGNQQIRSLKENIYSSRLKCLEGTTTNMNNTPRQNIFANVGVVCGVRCLAEPAGTSDPSSGGVARRGVAVRGGAAARSGGRGLDRGSEEISLRLGVRVLLS